MVEIGSTFIRKKTDPVSVNQPALLPPVETVST